MTSVLLVIKRSPLRKRDITEEEAAEELVMTGTETETEEAEEEVVAEMKEDM